MGWSRDWGPYVPVAKRRAEAAKKLAKLEKNSKGKARSPVKISTRKMAVTFWGEAWCDNLENYSDYSNRLPRGKTYARNGSILDLQIEKGTITAMVSGSSLYSIKIEISTIQAKLWNEIKSECAKSIHSIMDLLRGKLTDSVMKSLTAPKTGMFPQPKEIKLRCSCPDSAGLCKHLAAVMYGVGNRLDTNPELLFTLRGVDKSELVSEAVSRSQLSESLTSTNKRKNPNAVIADDDLSSLFGIDLVSAEPSTESAAKKKTVNKETTEKPSVQKRVKANVNSKVSPLAKLVERKRSTKKSAVAETTNSKPVVLKKQAINKPTSKKKKTSTTKMGQPSPGLPNSLRTAMEKLERK